MVRSLDLNLTIEPTCGKQDQDVIETGMLIPSELSLSGPLSGLQMTANRTSPQVAGYFYGCPSLTLSLSLKKWNE